MGRTHRNVTIRDVAKAAGVSKSTVSLVLQDSPKVAPKTRERVWAALDKLGYIPNAAARTLAQGRTGVIGLATVNFNQKLTERIYFSGIMGALLEVLAEHKYHMMIYNAAVPLQLAVDGMLFLSVNVDHPLVDQVKRARLPYAFLNRRTTDAETPYVSHDFAAGGRLAAEHFIELGHRHVGVLTWRPGIPPHKERLAGFQGALAEAYGGGATCTVIEATDLTPAAGYEGAMQMLSGPARPTAVFVSNYELLPGLLDCCRDLSLRIPGDLSVICFDDPWAAGAMDPPITVVRPASEEVGRLGAELIVSLVEGRQGRPAQTLISPRLIVRESTRPFDHRQ